VHDTELNALHDIYPATTNMRITGMPIYKTLRFSLHPSDILLSIVLINAYLSYKKETSDP
jgi:hypothetical protein